MLFSEVEKECRMFMFVLVVLVAFGLGSLLFGSIGLAAVGAGFLFFPLLILFKVVFFVMIVGFVARAFGRGGYGHRRPPWAWHDDDRHGPRPGANDKDRFEEWHRMAHAKEEVDSWAPRADE
jgi:multisubunit Na+/H+ antiporter MnhG subunit